MAAFTPVAQVAAKGTAGYTQQIVVGSNIVTSQTLTFAASLNNDNFEVTIVNNAAAGGVALYTYCRLTTEISTSIAATGTDFVLATPAQTATVKLFANPNKGNNCSIAFIATVSPSAAGSLIWVSPVNSGII